MSAIISYGYKLADDGSIDKNTIIELCKFILDEGLINLGTDLCLWNSERKYDEEGFDQVEPFTPGSFNELLSLLENSNPADIRILLKYKTRYGSSSEHPENGLTKVIDSELMDAAAVAAKKCDIDGQLDFYMDFLIGPQTVYEGYDPEKMEEIYRKIYSVSIGGDGYLPETDKLHESVMEKEGFFFRLYKYAEKVMGAEPKPYFDIAG